MAMTNAIIVRDFGLMPYDVVFAAMKAFTGNRTADTTDEIWLLEHPPVYTLGQASDRSHLLDTKNIPVFQADRGGEVTYHAPGQAVVYLLIDLKRRMGNRLLVREFVRKIEQAVIDTLSAYHLAGERKMGAPGIYLAADWVDPFWQGAKIAALGLKVQRNGCTYHGLSLNVAMDLQPFSGINPCGYPELTSVDMKTLGKDCSVTQVQHELAMALCRSLGTRADFQDSAALPVVLQSMEGDLHGRK
ncbi:MAG: lipoyl(octanoyl) transferase LipB [Oxalobacter sp.]|nr:lipoyl(octanoyl) transferase LipB [Oxalobacter sp.]